MNFEGVSMKCVVTKTHLFVRFLSTLLLIFISTTVFAKTITILSFNDFHGQLREAKGPEGKNPGMPKFVTAVKQIEKQAPNVIVVSGGDNYQGSCLSNLLFGSPVNRMMKMIHVAASAVGNHEFDWGTQWFKPWMKEGHFVYLAANIYSKKTGKLVSWAKPYLMVKKDGVKIAFIGLVTQQTPETTKYSNIKNLIFKKDVPSLQKWINFLRAGKDPAGKPDVIIALTHIPSFQNAKTKQISGEEISRVCRQAKGLDAVISGHSHQMVSGYLHHIPVVQAFCHGRALGKLTIVLNQKNQIIKITPSLVKLYKIKSSLLPNPEAEKIYQLDQSKIASKVDKVIGYAKGELSHHPHHKPIVTLLGSWAAKIVKNHFGVKVAIINGGNLRRGLYPGKITVGDLYEIEPFDNTIVTMKISGKALKNAIEHGILNPSVAGGNGQFAGLRLKYNSQNPFGKRIVSLTFDNGQPIHMHQYYSVATCDFVYTGGDGYDFQNAKDFVNTHVLMRDLFINAIKKQKIVVPQPVDYVADVAQQKKAA